MSSTESTTRTATGPLKLPIGISNFSELIKEHYTFVDKSPMIADVIREGAKVSLITRPRRFGKTLNLSMLHHFFASQVLGQPTEGLFNNLTISKDAVSMEYQGQYPVIFFSFKDIKEGDFEGVKTKLAVSIKELYSQYPELMSSESLLPSQRADIQSFLDKTGNLAEMAYAFKMLCEFLYRHYQKPVLLLIDEYDTPIHAAYLNGYYSEMAEFMRGLLGAALKDNSYLYKAVVTGILRVSSESLFSGLNNIKVHTVLDNRYSRYFGFTGEEVADLLKTPGLDQQTAQSSGQIRTWYNGYQFGTATVYNPWSIINYLEEEASVRSYWVNTSDNNLLKQLLARADGRFKQQLGQLVQNHSIEQKIDPNIVFGDLKKSATALWSLLLFSGYLTASESRYDDEGTVTCRLHIPNQEVQGLYKRHIKEWFSDTMGSEGYEHFLKCLVTGNIGEFEIRLEEYLRESASLFDEGQYHPEKFYHGLVLGLIAGLKETHLIHSNRESGYGRYDVAVLPRETAPADQHLGILLEFKSVKDEGQLKEAARAALQQIDRQRYQTELEQHKVEKIIKIGLAFSGKRMAMMSSTPEP